MYGVCCWTAPSVESRDPGVFDGQALTRSLLLGYNIEGREEEIFCRGLPFYSFVHHEKNRISVIFLPVENWPNLTYPSAQEPI